jgi:polyhydroxyalkanoate synthesis regulator phasin
MTIKQKKAVETEASAPENGHESPLEPLHKAMLAGIGAVAMGLDAFDKVTGRFIERGERVEKDAQKAWRQFAKEFQTRQKRAGRGLGKEMEDMREAMDIPSKSDIDALGEKIADLSTKVDALKAS